MYKSMVCTSVANAKKIKEEFNKLNDAKTIRQGSVINIKLTKNYDKNEEIFDAVSQVRQNNLSNLKY